MIDGNSESEIAATFLFKHEDEGFIHHMTQIFTDRKPSWEKVEVVISDKDREKCDEI